MDWNDLRSGQAQLGCLPAPELDFAAVVREHVRVAHVATEFFIGNDAGFERIRLGLFGFRITLGVGAQSNEGHNEQT